MEIQQVNKLRLNVKNIKSVLISSNRTLLSLRKQENNSINLQQSQEKQKEKEKKIEKSGIGNSIETIKNSIISGPMSIFDKMKEFFGTILLALVIQNLPQIISRLEKFFGEVGGITKSVKGFLDSLGSGLNALIKSVMIFPQQQKKNDADQKQLKSKIDETGKSFDDLDRQVKNLINPKKPTAPKQTPQKPKKDKKPVVEHHATGGIVGSQQPGSTKLMSGARTGTAKRALASANYFGTFNKSVDNVRINTVAGEKTISSFDKMVENFKEFVRLTLPDKEDNFGDDGDGGDGGGNRGGDGGGGGGGMLPGDAPPQVKAMLDAISGGEGSWDSVNPGTTVSGLSNMTIAEARRAAMKKGYALGGSAAMGKWQQMPEFILGRAKSAGLDPNIDKFSPENQTKIARMLMSSVYPGGEKQLVKDAKRDPLAASANLRGTWPSLPGGSQENTSSKTFLSRYRKRVSYYDALKEQKSAASIAQLNPNQLVVPSLFSPFTVGQPVTTVMLARQVVAVQTQIPTPYLVQSSVPVPGLTTPIPPSNW